MNPSFLQKAALNLVVRFLQRTRNGRLTVTLPQGESLDFGGECVSTAALHVSNWSFFPRLLRDGDVSLAKNRS